MPIYSYHTCDPIRGAVRKMPRFKRDHNHGARPQRSKLPVPYPTPTKSRRFKVCTYMCVYICIRSNVSPNSKSPYVDRAESLSILQMSQVPSGLAHFSRLSPSVDPSAHNLDYLRRTRPHPRRGMDECVPKTYRKVHCRLREALPFFPNPSYHNHLR